MKTIKTLAIFIVAFATFSCNNTVTKQNKKITIDKSISKIEILDFYGKHRCKTCINIEANTRYTLDIAFKDEVNAEKIVFKTINFDDDKNEEIVTEYQAYGTSLFLNIIKNGKEEHIDLTDFAFKWGNEKVEYSMMLEKKIKEALKKL